MIRPPSAGVENSALPTLRKRLGDFHAMLDRLMAQHLSAIQVLGYILGAIIGALQCV